MDTKTFWSEITMLSQIAVTDAKPQVDEAQDKQRVPEKTAQTHQMSN